MLGLSKVEAAASTAPFRARFGLAPAPLFGSMRFFGLETLSALARPAALTKNDVVSEVLLIPGKDEALPRIVEFAVAVREEAAAEREWRTGVE